MSSPLTFLRIVRQIQPLVRGGGKADSSVALVQLPMQTFSCKESGTKPQERQRARTDAFLGSCFTRVQRDPHANPTRVSLKNTDVAEIVSQRGIADAIFLILIIDLFSNSPHYVFFQKRMGKERRICVLILGLKNFNKHGAGEGRASR